LKQGRHRGKKVGNLRDATEGELNEARSIARFVVESTSLGSTTTVELPCSLQTAASDG
jgi:hypothetical protein